LDRLMRLDTERSAAWRSASSVLSAVQTWLRDRPSSTLADYKGEAPKVNKGEDVLVAIERHRRRGRELKADLNRVQSAPYPANYAKAQMRLQIETLAQRGACNVGRLVERDGPVEFPMQLLQVPGRNVPNAAGAAVGFLEAPDVLALTCWLHRDTLLERLDREIDDEADDANAMSIDARQKAEAVIDGDLLNIERDEAALTWRALAQGQPVAWRADINPAALLGLLLVTAPASNGSPGTSAGLVFDLLRP
jgi:hypothetical protein